MVEVVLRHQNTTPYTSLENTTTIHPISDLRASKYVSKPLPPSVA